MRLYVCLVHHIQPQNIAQLVKLRHIGIVRCTDSIDICPLHEFQVCERIVHAYRRPRFGIHLMAIDAFEFDMPAVEHEHAVPNPDPTQSHAL